LCFLSSLPPGDISTFAGATHQFADLYSASSYDSSHSSHLCQKTAQNIINLANRGMLVEMGSNLVDNTAFRSSILHARIPMRPVPTRMERVPWRPLIRPRFGRISVLSKGGWPRFSIAFSRSRQAQDNIAPINRIGSSRGAGAPGSSRTGERGVLFPLRCQRTGAG